MAKPNYRHQKRQREAQRLTRQAEKLQRRQAARTESGTPGENAGEVPVEITGAVPAGPDPAE